MTPKPADDRKNLRTRVLSGLVLGPIVMVAVVSGGLPFIALMTVGAVVGVMEFCALGRGRGIPGVTPVGVVGVLCLVVLFTLNAGIFSPLILLGVLVAAYIVAQREGGDETTKRNRALLTTGAVAYIGLMGSFLIGVRGISAPQGLMWMLFVLFATWGTDTFAYIGGRLFGKHPLAPSISPKKTQEGALVGLIAGTLLASSILLVAQQETLGRFIVAALCSAGAIMGDLAESKLKRVFHAGDSHVAGLDLIPGHGGVLDRTDSLFWVVTLVYIYLLATGLVTLSGVSNLLGAG